MPDVGFEPTYDSRVSSSLATIRLDQSGIEIPMEVSMWRLRRWGLWLAWRCCAPLRPAFGLASLFNKGAMNVTLCCDLGVGAHAPRGRDRAHVSREARECRIFYLTIRKRQSRIQIYDGMRWGNIVRNYEDE